MERGNKEQKLAFLEHSWEEAIWLDERDYLILWSKEL